MPRKTKDANELSEKNEKKATAKKTTAKKATAATKKTATTKKSTTTKKATAKATTKAKKVNKATDTSPAEKELKKVSPKKTTKKALTTSKKSTKAVAVKEEKTKALTTTKKSAKAVAVKEGKTKALTTTKKSTKAVAVKEKKTKALTTTKKVTTKASAKKDSKELTITEKLQSLYTEDEKNRKETVEYYDLPYNYNETVVKILAQTPKKLFVYWDMSKDDIDNYIKIFGQEFFDATYPVLIVHNEDKNYSYEVKINDFANSWYIDIENSKCKYSIDYGRKFKTRAEIKNEQEFKQNHVTLQNDYLFISNSNKIESPNDHILFENYTMNSTIRYRNVKTNEITTKKINTLPIFKIIKNIYSAESGLEGLYDSLYGLNGLSMKNFFDLGNPSSGNPSSGNPTSRFID